MIIALEFREFGVWGGGRGGRRRIGEAFKEIAVSVCWRNYSVELAMSPEVP